MGLLLVYSTLCESESIFSLYRFFFMMGGNNIAFFLAVLIDGHEIIYTLITHRASSYRRLYTIIHRHVVTTYRDLQYCLRLFLSLVKVYSDDEL